MTYGLVAIVKNEVERIAPMLGSARQYISSWTILDTGSEDGTPALVLGAMGDIDGTLGSTEFINFGQARSEAFAQARGTADWLLALDADMTVEIDDDFEPDPAIDCYMIRMGSGDFVYRLPLLLRGDLPWESRGPVHEYTCLPDRPYVSDFTNKVRVSVRMDGSSPEKSRWHATLLEAHLADHADDARSVFYLAQTYADLGDPRAVATYERRLKLGGWAEETFYAAYRYARLLPTWPARMLALTKAWELRPGRLEAPYELAREFNLRGLHQAAYRFASLPVEPTNDILFVHAGVWDWGMAFERSIAAWWLGLWDEFEALTAILLDNPSLPDNIRAQVIANSEFERAA
jgi:hypothetical protein